MPPVPQRKGEWLTNVVERIDQSGLSAETVAVRRTDITYVDSEDLPDILSVLADQTQLTRATLAHVLTESGTLEQFRRNPQAYVGQVTTRIKSTKERFLVGGLRYELIDESRPENERRYPLTLFQDANLSGYTGKGGNIVSDYEGNPVSFDDKSVYEYVVVDSTVEREFALRLRQHEEVKAFVKLPPSFTVPTPLGTYNPDWAVTVERPDGSRYFVFETKGTTDEALLRESERGRIASARIHFMTVRARLGIDDVEYAVVDSMKTADGFFEGTRTLRSLE